MSADFTTARLNMVESQVRTQDVTDTAIHYAMRRCAARTWCRRPRPTRYADSAVEYARRWLLHRGRRQAAAGVSAPAGNGAAIAAPSAAALLEARG